MDYQSFFLYDPGSGASFVQLRPTAKFAESRPFAKEETPTLGGQLHSYLPGQAGWEWTLPLEMVNSATRSQLMTWWASQQELLFTINPTSTTNAGSPAPLSALVRIANMLEPLGTNPEPRTDLFNGGLTLRQSQGAGASAVGGFILDDPVLGLLDQSYNGLV